ncbi:MAG: DNA polymerase I [Leptospiraceae bacterium]|nr:MAG: DNA polymerase I [Leptospiraceae bacterium]
MPKKQKKSTKTKQNNSLKQADLIIIDAHALAYKAYYALLQQNLRNSDGMPTGAIYGFFRMLFKLLNEYKPKYVAITWDPPEKTFRHEIYTEYKANRKPMPDDLSYQIEVIKEFLKKIGFPIIISPNYEADDIIGTLVEKFKDKYKIILLTGDKDCFQLLGKNVIMLRGRKGVSEFIEITPEFLMEENGITPEQVPDYMALVGDTSDNIPGAKGIGPKTAAELIQKYKTIENLYEHLEELKPSIRQKLIESKENVFLSKKLCTIKRDLEDISKITEEKLKIPNYLSHEVLTFFRREGFQQIYKDLLKEFLSNEDTTPDIFESISSSGIKKYDNKISNYRFIATEDDLKQCIEEISKYKEIVIDTETSSLNVFDAKLVGISLCGKEHQAYYISVIEEDSLFANKGIPLEKVKKYLETINKEQYRFIGQNLKFDYKILYKKGIKLKHLYFDTMIASYLLNPGIRQHNLDDIAMEYLGYETIKYKEIAGEGKKQKTFDQIDPEKIYIYSCEDADITYQVYKILKDKLVEKDLLKVHDKIECPLIEVLATMEFNGVKIDTKYFQQLSNDYELKINELTKKIYEEAGVEFNINSTKELQHILFEKMQLPIQKKTKTGYSTDQSVLESLKNFHPIIEYLLQYRKLTKLKNTYIDVLPNLIEPSTGRIHTNYSQTITSTGRLASSNPNLQNIPVKEEEGRAIRKGFIAEKGYKIVSLDYSQIELRILAHYSNDKNLIQAFINNEDIHTQTAISLFGLPKDKITPDMRSKAKILNFSIIYGVTPYGLSQNLGIEPKEAKEYIDKFMENYPGVKNYIVSIIKFAEQNYYVETLLGRKRYIPDINSSNRRTKEAAERIAINTPIQGTSADIIKIAMIEIHKQLEKNKMQSKMILQVHDELVFEAKNEEIDELISLAKEKMENAVKLNVPLKVDIGIGDNWEEAH